MSKQNRGKVDWRVHALLVAVAGTLLLASGNTHAEQVKRRLPACLSEDLLDEITRYATKSDTNGFMQLLRSGQCVMLPAGEQISVIDRGFITSAVRFRGMKLYTPSEAIR